MFYRPPPLFFLERGKSAEANVAGMLGVPPVSGGSKCAHHMTASASLRLFKMFLFYIRIWWIHSVGFVSGLVCGKVIQLCIYTISSFSDSFPL